MNTTPSEYEIHAYVDGYLDESRKQAVEFYLAQHPERAEEIRAWRRDAQQLRATFGAWPEITDNPNLNPSRIRASRRKRMHTRWAAAAMLVLSLGVGGFGGWQMHGWQIAQASLPMGDALAAYRLVAQDRTLQLDVASDNEVVLQRWINRQFEHSIRLPNLQDAGYRPVGGRLFIADQSVAAMVLYEDAQHHVISFYVRPPSRLHDLIPYGQRTEGGLLAQYGSDRSHNFAIVSHADGVDKEAAARALKSII